MSNNVQNFGSLWSSGISLGDLDNDGDLDIFVSHGNGNDSTNANKVWLNDGFGGFTDSGQEIGNSDGRGVALKDLDKDGDLDAFIAIYGACSKVWKNDGLGNFTDSKQCLVSSGAQEIMLGDVNGDGSIDALVSGVGGNKLWLNDGFGTFTDSGQFIGSDSMDSALGDLDGDGDIDAFVTTRSINKVWLNNSTSSFTFSLTVSKIGEGTITYQGIDCGKDCTESYNNGSTVNLITNPADGYQFVEWTGGCSDSFVITEDMTCSAIFKEDSPPTCTGNNFAVFSTIDRKVNFDKVAMELYNPWDDQPNGKFALFTGVGGAALVLEALTGFDDFKFPKNLKLKYTGDVVDVQENCYATYSAANETLDFGVKIPWVTVLPNGTLIEGPVDCYDVSMKQSTTQQEVFHLTNATQIDCD